MHTRKIHWAIWAVLWLGIMIGGFFFLEVPALTDSLGITLSQTLADIAYAWPPAVFWAGLVLGIVTGTLVTHILWTWVPKQKRTECVECGKTVILTLLLLAVLAGPSLARDLILPDPELTPGVATEITAEQLCDKEFRTKDVRSVSAAMKREVFARYGLTGNTDKACKRDKHGRHCEVDHLVSLELGGANVIENLWPQPFGTKPWNAVMKDKVENRLHREVCKHTITLEQAQHEIATDYRVPYVRYFGEPQ